MSVSAAVNKTAPDTLKESILRAAISEFGRVGYESASTNEIVKKANVSKGLLFHYFTSKEKLYIACQLHVMEEYGQHMHNNSDYTSPDFFDRILENLYIKMEYGRKNPEFLAFINRALFTDAKENPLERSEAENYILKNMKGPDKNVASSAEEIKHFLFDGTNTELLKDDVDLMKLFVYTRQILESFWERFASKHNNDGYAMVQNIGDYFKEAEDLLSLLKYGAYK